jgi:hypothetical protein
MGNLEKGVCYTPTLMFTLWSSYQHQYLPTGPILLSTLWPYIINLLFWDYLVKNICYETCFISSATSFRNVISLQETWSDLPPKHRN